MKYLIVGLLIIIVLGGAGFMYFSSKNNSSQNTSLPIIQNQPTQQATPTTQPENKTYTMAEVATHNNQSSCWAVINNNVYDLTNWISQHPGGPSKILGLCGTDGSEKFNGQHSGQAQPANALDGFYIGTLQ